MQGKKAVPRTATHGINQNVIRDGKSLLDHLSHYPDNAALFFQFFSVFLSSDLNGQLMGSYSFL